MSTILGYLVGQVGEFSGARIAIPERGLVIGRDPKHADLVLEHPLVSRRHAQIASSAKNVLVLSDLGSRNGTFLNGHRVDKAAGLRPADKIDFGGQGVAVFQFDSAESSSLTGFLSQVFRQSAAPVEWQPGDVILDLYEVKKVLGQGGMGKVYLVHHKAWNADLAVKCPLPKLFADEKAVENFVREAEMWVNLDLHPNIVQCHYIRTIGGLPRIFAEYVSGGSLHDWIAEKKLSRLDQILDVAIQFAWGLHAAHRKGLVHQDVKPLNVLMTPEGTAKVSDFGLARARALAGESTAARQNLLVSVGGMTPAYCSPEQASGRKLTPKSDIWSWALSVLQIFTGGVVWRFGTEAPEVLARYGRFFGRSSAVRIPKRLRRLLSKCFHVGPDERPKDMLEIVAELQSIYRETNRASYPLSEPKAAELLADEYNNRALSLRDLGADSESVRMMEEALAIHPGHLPLVFNHGILAWRSGQCTDLGLLTELREIRKRETTNWTAVYAEGLAQLERGDIESAIALLEESVRQGGDETVKAALKGARALLPESARYLGPLEGKVSIVGPVLITPDEECILSNGPDKTLRLWSVDTRRCIRTLEGHGEDVATMAISADGNSVVSGSQDKTLRMWNVQTGRCMHVIETPTHYPTKVALSPDGRCVASAGPSSGESDDFSVRLWDTSTGLLTSTLHGHTRAILSLCFSSDGQWILSGGWDCTVRLWSTATGRCIRVFKGHTIAITSVALTRDSRWAISGSMDSTMRLWEVNTGRCLWVFPHSDMVYSVSISADGRWALSGGWGAGMCLWYMPVARCLRTFGIENPSLTIVASSSLGARLRYAVSKNLDATLHLWSIAALCRNGLNREVAPMLMSRPRAVREMADIQNRFSGLMEEAQRALSAGGYGDALRLADAGLALQGFGMAKAALDLRARAGLRCSRSGIRRVWCKRTFNGHEGLVGAVSLSAEGKYVLSGSNDSTIRVWDAATGRCVRTLTGHDRTVNCVVGDLYNGREVLSGSYDCTLRLWEIDTGLCIRKFEGHDGCVYSAYVSRDGKWMVSGGADKTARLWELSTGRCLHVFTGHTGDIQAVSLSPDGQWMVTGSYDRKVYDDEASGIGHLAGATEKMLRLWHLPTGKCVKILEGHTSGVQSVAFSEDGRVFLSGSDDGTLRVWELETGMCLHKIEAGTQGVLSSDGRWALSSGRGHTLRLWNLKSGTCERVLEGHMDTISSVFLSVDSRWVLSGSMDRTIRLWELDWDFAPRQAVDWDEGARWLLTNFLVLHTPYAMQLPKEREPTEEEVTLALTRRGKPVWTDADFTQLLHTLGCAGYGWLRPQGVRRELVRMASTWDQPSKAHP
jgi:WD40 repeat protein/serine/threonine protein kinase